MNNTLPIKSLNQKYVIFLCNSACTIKTVVDHDKER